MNTPNPWPWPVNGYAPGDYMCKCRSCGCTFQADKRAWNCLECAVHLLVSLDEEKEAPETEFEKWWRLPSEKHRGRSSTAGTIQTNGDFVMSLWSNPVMKEYAEEIFNAGVLIHKEPD